MPTKRFVQAQSRSQCTLFPGSVDDFIADDNPVRVIDVFVGELHLAALGFEGAEPERTGRPAYHPSTLLKIYIYGYLNRVQVEPPIGTRNAAESRVDLVDRPTQSRL